jgi:hypothetical protein
VKLALDEDVEGATGDDPAVLGAQIVRKTDSGLLVSVGGTEYRVSVDRV